MSENNKDLEESNNENISENKDKEINQDILSAISSEEKKEISPTTETQIIYDMNLKSIDDLINILSKNEFDFLVIEPLESYVRISFKKDSILKSQKYIRYPVYSSLLIAIKKLTTLDIEKIDIEQK
jgi:type II secretory ATPase GspE/PulE/Tfp pilus assembly ATPase PilB-like protein